MPAIYIAIHDASADLHRVFYGRCRFNRIRQMRTNFIKVLNPPAVHVSYLTAGDGYLISCGLHISPIGIAAICTAPHRAAADGNFIACSVASFHQTAVHIAGNTVIGVRAIRKQHDFPAGHGDFVPRHVAAGRAAAKGRGGFYAIGNVQGFAGMPFALYRVLAPFAVQVFLRNSKVQPVFPVGFQRFADQRSKTAVDAIQLVLQLRQLLRIVNGKTAAAVGLFQQRNAFVQIQAVLPAVCCYTHFAAVNSKILILPRQCQHGIARLNI